MRLPLEHSLFDNDAIILGNTCRRILIKNTADSRQIALDYPNSNISESGTRPRRTPLYLLEPWSALPATEGITDDLETKKDMTHLAPGKTFRNVWGV